MTFAEYIRFLFGKCKEYEALMLDFSAKHREYVIKANKIKRPYKRPNDWLKHEAYITEIKVYEVYFDSARERLRRTINLIGLSAKRHYTRAFKRAKAEYENVPRDFHYVCMSLMKEQDQLQEAYDVWVKKSGKMMGDYYRELKK